MWEPENKMVVSQEWYTHPNERPERYYGDYISYCEIYACSECPRYGDDCDGEDDDEE